MMAAARVANVFKAGRWHAAPVEVLDPPHAYMRLTAVRMYARLLGDPGQLFSLDDIEPDAKRRIKTLRWIKHRYALAIEHEAKGDRYRVAGMVAAGGVYVSFKVTGPAELLRA